MIRHYRTSDPLAASKYVINRDSAQRLVLTPVNAIDKLLKGDIQSRPFESYDEFISRIGFIPA